MYCEGCKWLDINETNNSVISIRSLRPKIYCKRYETSLTKTDKILRLNRCITNNMKEV